MTRGSESRTSSCARRRRFWVAPSVAPCGLPSDRGDYPSAWAPTPCAEQPHADGEAVGQDEPHRAAERFRITGVPLGDCELDAAELTCEGWSSGAHRPAVASPSGGSLLGGLAPLDLGRQG